MAIGRTGEQETPLVAQALACRVRVWGLFGETHLGQRSSRHRVKDPMGIGQDGTE
jgi:hypothetical protein